MSVIFDDELPPPKTRKKAPSQLAPKPCADCGDAVMLGNRGRFCLKCRFKPGNRKPTDRKVYKTSEEIDRKFREEFVPYEPGCTERFARELRWPVHVVQKHARVLGVSKPIPEWNALENSILEEWAGRRKAKWIAEEINRQIKGAHRSESQVENRLRRMGLAVAVEHEGYSAAQLAACFGVAGHTVEGWIRKGLLNAKRSDTLNGMRYPWVIRERDVIAFVFEHPREFTLRKVDQTWFLDLMNEHVRASIAAAFEHRRPKRRPGRPSNADREMERLCLRA